MVRSAVLITGAAVAARLGCACFTTGCIPGATASGSSVATARACVCVTSAGASRGTIIAGRSRLRAAVFAGGCGVARGLVVITAVLRLALVGVLHGAQQLQAFREVHITLEASAVQAVPSRGCVLLGVKLDPAPP